MDILLIGQADSIFFEHYTKTIKKLRPDINIDVFSINPISGKYDLSDCHYIYVNTWSKSFFKSVKGVRTLIYPFYTWFSLYKFLKRREKKYDIIHFKWLVPSVILFPDLIRKYAIKTIGTFWGQEYKIDEIFFSNKIYQFALRIFLRKTDAIINHGVNTKEYLISVLGNLNKFYIARYGSSILKELDKLKFNNESKSKSKNKLGIDPDKITVAIGYSAKKDEQHIKIISELFKNDDFKYKADNFFFVFQMNYGYAKGHINDVENEIKTHTKNYRILKPQIYTDTEIARYRNAIDIRIQLASTDGLSASIIETFYSGGLIISGKWLPYEVFRKSNLHFYELDSIDQKLPELLLKLSDKIDNELELCEQNKVKWNYDSWEKVIPSWINAYEDVLNKTN